MKENERRQRDRDRRRSARVPQHYMLSFRPVSAGPQAEWDISNIRNVSEGGILFYATQPLDVGAILEIKIHTPSGTENQKCRGQVMRCESLPDRKGIFATVVDITMFDDNTKTTLYQTISEYIKKNGVPPERRKRG